ncbi:MAG: hypothetical protein Q8K58_00355 [Acidimicrobiales bacterium]|nr:hypothetical protein [Acidimicrobiales bacterium]
MIGGANVKRITRALADLQRAKTAVKRLDAARRAREAADDLEQAHVAAARAAGLTWAQIGEVYGLTKQGAQQRFRGERTITG